MTEAETYHCENTFQGVIWWFEVSLSTEEGFHRPWVGILSFMLRVTRVAWVRQGEIDGSD